jgi:hypothetical protein
MIDRRYFLAGLGSLTSGSVFGASKYQISTFSIEITPPIGHPCMGGGISPVKSIEDPLYALGFVLQGEGQPIVHIILDWCEVRNDAYDRWREVIATAVNSTRERVMLSSVHQHDTPIADLRAEKLLRQANAKGSICDLDFHEATVQRVAKGIKASLANSVTVTHIGIGQAKVEGVASNRRYEDEVGKIQYNRMSATRDAKIRDAAEGTIDPNLKVISFWNEQRPIVALNAYATHPMSYYGQGKASSDFVGLARKKRQSDLPKTLQIYASGCSGNVTAGKFNDGSAANRPILAEKIATAMKNAWDVQDRKAIESIEFRNTPFHLHARSEPSFSREQLEKRLKDGPRPFDQCLAALGLSWLERVEKKQPIDLPVIDFGFAALMILPAEAYVEFQLAAQAVRPKDFVLVSGYGECGPGYIPIERAWKEQDSNLHDWCWVDPGSERLLKQAITKALGK